MMKLSTATRLVTDSKIYMSRKRSIAEKPLPKIFLPDRENLLIGKKKKRYREYVTRENVFKNVNYENIAKAYNALQFILEDLELLCGDGSVPPINTGISKAVASFCEDLKLIRYFLKRVQETSTLVRPDREVALLASRSVRAVNKLLDDVVGIYMDQAFQQEIWYRVMVIVNKHSGVIGSLVKKIKAVDLYDYSNSFLEASYSYSKNSSSIDGNSILGEKFVVGFEDEARQLLGRLICGQKQLEVISIVGMPGIGKTTLAKRLYNDSSIVYHFHIRAWTCVSQFYRKTKVLQSILSSILSRDDPIFHRSDEDMEEKLYRCLKGQRFLIVIDDAWDVGVWNDLEMCFPKDDNCSRILITSRIKDVALKVRQNSPPHCLRFLTQDEGWDLFKHKVFGEKSCPEELMELGNQIVAKCKGLPLAIVVIAGSLAREKEKQEYWRQVAENIGSSINSNSEQFMDAVELSYNNLPSFLKSCFLYLGSFPEDFDIPVRRLLQSWIAEGFIQQTDEKRLEDVAEDYLMDLVNRSLVIVAKKRSDGGLKSCRIHDVLRDLCHRKADEKKFVLPVCNCGHHKSRLRKYKGRYRHFSYCQYFHSYNFHYVQENQVFNKETLAVYKFLNKLDLRHIILDSFPRTILHLIHLKYLALQLDRLKYLPSMFFQLWKLETCILDGEKGERVTLPCDIFKMAKLRHLKISAELIFEDPVKCFSTELPGNCSNCFQRIQSQQHDTGDVKVLFNFLLPSPSSSTNLGNLQSLSQLCPAGFVNEVLGRTPSLKKLGFHFTLSEGKKTFSFPDLSHLNLLEAFKFEYQTFGMVPLNFPQPKTFPPSLKKLTLIGSHVDWKEMSIVELLPNLEVLKVKDNFFSGPQWETTDHGFPNLKFLKLSHMDLKVWISSSSHFPQLEKLVLNGCLELEEIPSEMADVPTLEVFEVYRSSQSTMKSAREIQEANSSMGNGLELFIFHHFEQL